MTRSTNGFTPSNFSVMATTRNRFSPRSIRVVALFLVTLSIAIVPLTPLASPSPAHAVCAPPILDCTTGAIGGGGVILDRTKTKPAVPGKPAVTAPGGKVIVIPPPSGPPSLIAFLCAVYPVRPWYCPTPPAAPKPAIPSRPAISLSSLASFVPRTPSLVSEPRGWGLVGLPMNFIATEPIHDVAGTLLGTAATVRFTPTSFAWAYGDGGTRTSSTPGFSWASLRLASFSPTATSHVFTIAATRTVRVTVTLTASYRLGNGAWTPISGALTRSVGISVRLVSAADPLLVSDPCVPGNPSLGC